MIRAGFRWAAWAIVAALSVGGVQGKDLRWSALNVKARLDASGNLSVVETQRIVFDGDWNGGERTFRVFPGQSLSFQSLTRVDSDGSRHLLSPGSLSAVDEWSMNENVLRWRSRLPSDPPFAKTELVYELAYMLAGVLVKLTTEQGK